MSGMAETRKFTAVQYAFARHIRDPEHTAAPADVEARRMAIYCELFYNNVQSFIANSYPVLRKITPDERWHAMVRDYFNRHKARTPLFPKMPQEFLRYLEHERDARDDPPFLAELAHYEWMELAMSIDPREINGEGIDADGDLLEGVPVASPLASLLCYRYPVHRISPGYQPLTPPDQPTWIVVYRDRHYQVGFIELNLVAARLLELIQAGSGASGRKLLVQIAGELGHPDPDEVISGGLEIMQNLHRKDILPGVSLP
jgi:hypothetical protein